MFAFQTVALMLVLVIILLFLTKPSIFFTTEGQVKGFGTDSETTTPFTLVIFIYLFVVVLYSICVFVEQ